jgi:CxxC-x17-CxxC domain-containing protein
MPEGDKVLKCRDCGEEFVFTAGEQAFYRERGFQHEPTRCRRCRDLKKGSAAGAGGNQAPRPAVPTGGPRELFEAVCSSCGVATQVPFRPTPGKPVYCRDCFQSVRTARGVTS